jgi:uncharacterized sulfatase
MTSHVLAKSDKPNVLLLVADDLCADLGCYGGPIQSPNIDKLASEGVRFERAYCQYPLCGPSRASFLSGLRPETEGVVNNEYRSVREKIYDLVTLPQLFRNNGYYTARTGKLFHLIIPRDVGTGGSDDALSWNYAFNPEGAEYTTLGQSDDPDPKNDQSFHEVMDEGDGREQHDYQCASEAIRLLNKHKDDSFFLAVGFIRPHVPEIAPKSFFDLYDLNQIKLPDNPPNDRDDVPPVAFRHKEINFGMTIEQCIRAKRAYYATASFMDAQLGRVMNELERLKLRDKTIVVFISDHGYLLGQHQEWQKTNIFEEACRVPMIISVPGQKPAKVSGLVELLDLYPTLAELCGLEAPKTLEGQSIAAMLSDPNAKVHEATTTIVKRKNFFGRSIRTGRFRYTEWDNGKAGVELYDHRTDPDEFKNLANDPKFAAQMKELSTKLHELSPDKK